jgi:NAD(P)-dependent dehydrogenase (short-subunit alcohol dehydrogenase family)
LTLYFSLGPTNTDLFTVGKSAEAIERLASMAALGRIGEPEDIAKLVLFLIKTVPDSKTSEQTYRA